MFRQKITLGKTIDVLLWVAALALLAGNISLINQNRRLRETIAPQVAAGSHLQTISGTTLDGQIDSINLPAAGPKLLIITFSPGCPACQANQERWMQLARMLKQQGVRTLWVSRDSIEITRNYCLKVGVALGDVLADPPHLTYVQLGLARVPNTILVGSGGHIDRIWAARLDDAGWESVRAYFSGDPGSKPTDARL